MPKDTRGWCALPPNGLQWTRRDQAYVWINYHFRIVYDIPEDTPRRLYKAKIAVSPGVPDVTVEKIHALIARSCFRRIPIFVKAYDFIEQQNTFGYVGAWEDLTIAAPKKNPRWLRIAAKKQHAPLGQPPKLQRMTGKRADAPFVQITPDDLK